MRNNWQPAGTRSWPGSWPPTLPPRRRIWIARLVDFWPAQKLRALGLKLELTTSMLPGAFQGRRTGRNGATMKRMGYVFLAEIVLTGALVSLAGAQSQPLGDYARTVRKEDKKEAAKKYDNDNLPKTDKISIVGQTPESTAAEDANPGSPADANAAPADSSTAVTPAAPQDTAKTAEETKKPEDQSNKRIADRKA